MREYTVVVKVLHRIRIEASNSEEALQLVEDIDFSNFDEEEVFDPVIEKD